VRRRSPSRPEPLWNRNFLLLWTGQATSLFGDRLAYMALFGLVIYTLDGSALHLGTLLASMFIPYFLLGPFAGVLVDRWPRRMTVVVTDLGRAAIYAWLAQASSINSVLPAVFAASALRVFFQPALTSLVPSIVPAANLQVANSALRAARGVCRMAGPAVGGALPCRRSRCFSSEGRSPSNRRAPLASAGWWPRCSRGSGQSSTPLSLGS